MSDSQKIKLKNAAFIVMMALMVSRLTGFLREMLVPAKLGVGRVSDAYTYAFLLPDLMYTLIIGGAISAALVPVLSGYIGKNEESDGWKAVGTFMNVTLIIMVCLCTLGIIFTPQMIELVASGYGKEKPVDMALTIKLTRTLFPSISFLMMAGLCNGVLYSYKKFAAAAFGPSIYNLFTAASFFLFSNKSMEDHYGVEKVALGVLGGTAIYFMIQVFQARKYLTHYRPVIHIKQPGFIRLFKLAVPSLISSSVMQVNIIISMTLASFFGEGSATALRMADRLWQMPLGIIAQGLGTAMLPSLSEKYAVGEHESYSNTLMKGLKMVLLLSIPCSFALMVLSHPIIKTIYQFSNKMEDADVALTSGILIFFSFALIMQSANAIVNRGFFAKNDTKTPLFVSTLTITGNIALCLFFKNYTSLGVKGMALAYSLSSTLNASVLLFLLNKKTGGIKLKSFLTFILKVILASTVMAVVVYFVSTFFTFEGSKKLWQFIYLSVITLTGITVFFGGALLLKISEAVALKRMVTAKIQKIKR